MSINKNIAVIGQGYVGLPLAIAAAESGWNVFGIDISKSLIKKLQSGESHIEDIENFRLINSINTGRYRATSDFENIRNCSIVIFCVPTPLLENQDPDLTALMAAVESAKEYLSEKTLIINESTSFPGTLRNLIAKKILALHANKNLEFGSAPERINPGDKNWKMNNTPRLVSGLSENAINLTFQFYSSFCNKVIKVETPEIAETAKLLENTFRLVNISLINEFTRICSKAGINIRKVIDAANSKPYGFMPFYPSAGIGGHCIPVDPMYLTYWARSIGEKSEIVEASAKVNNDMSKTIYNRARNIIGSNPKKILLLGVAYKSGISDVRESASEKIKRYFELNNAIVDWLDPLVEIWGDKEPSQNLSGYDMAIIVTHQPNLPIAELIANKTPILDCTYTLNKKEIYNL